MDKAIDFLDPIVTDIPKNGMFMFCLHIPKIFIIYWTIRERKKRSHEIHLDISFQTSFG